MADQKNTQRTSSGAVARDAGRSERHFFDEWVDRRLKTMHDAVLDEKIPDDMMRMLLGDAPPEPINPERGTSDEPNRAPSQGKPHADRDRRQ